MRTKRLLEMAIVMVVLATSWLTGASATVAGQRELAGHFVAGPSPSPLGATFTPTAEGQYTVVFRFNYMGEEKIWQGSAEGNLDDGALQGTVEVDGTKFRFYGVVKSGVFSGRQATVYEQDEEDQGTFSLQPGKYQPAEVDPPPSFTPWSPAPGGG